MVIFVLDLLNEFETTLMFGILFARTDKRISAIHVTIFAAMINLTSFIHKTYIFFLVDKFGIFVPQVVLTSASLAAVCLLRGRFLGLETLPKEKWHISDKLIKSQNKVK